MLAFVSAQKARIRGMGSTFFNTTFLRHGCATTPALGFSWASAMPGDHAASVTEAAQSGVKSFGKAWGWSLSEGKSGNPPKTYQVKTCWTRGNMD